VVDRWNTELPSKVDGAINYPDIYRSFAIITFKDVDRHFATIVLLLSEHLTMANSSHTSIKTKDYLSLVGQFPDNVPVTVIHMLCFNSTAIYRPSSPYASLERVSGRDAFYQRYIPAGSAAAKEVGITPAETCFFSTSVTNLLLHNDKPWDMVAARKYESFADYARYQASKAYIERAAPHRDAALKDWSLVACIEEEPPKI
jgi:hypothetical protein